MSDAFDIAIVGGGMVGASLAVALKGLDARVALIEAVPHGAASQPSFDERTTALSNGSRRILETLGVWPDVAAMATPIAKIHVSDRGHFGFARIDARRAGSAGARATWCRIARSGAALWSQLGAIATMCAVFCPARGLACCGRRSGAVELEVAEAGGAELRIKTQLVVAADGVESAVREAFGVAADVRDYEQTAVITTVLPRKFHEYVAYERFTASGPLALLPLADGRCTLVLTLEPRTGRSCDGLVGSRNSWPKLQRRFGFRLGRFLKVGRRVAYPLSLTRARRTSAGRCVIVGNAAQGLHPVAGMGFNLGLRDVASLAELVAEHCDRLAGPRQRALSSAYDAWRAGGSPRNHRLHRRPGAGVFQSRGAGAAAAQLGTAGVRSAAARESGAVLA